MPKKKAIDSVELLTEAITLIQTHKLARFPIVLVGKDYWEGMLQWIKTTVLSENNISAEDLNVISVADTAAEAVKFINDFYTLYELKPNF